VFSKTGRWRRDGAFGFVLGCFFYILLNGIYISVRWRGRGGATVIVEMEIVLVVRVKGEECADVTVGRSKSRACSRR